MAVDSTGPFSTMGVDSARAIQHRGLDSTSHSAPRPWNSAGPFSTIDVDSARRTIQHRGRGQRWAVLHHGCGQRQAFQHQGREQRWLFCTTAVDRAWPEGGDRPCSALRL